MSLESLTPVDTRFLFRPISSSLVELLRRLSPDDWLRPTIAGHWRVRDIVAHLTDVALRRLSFHRDAMPPPSPGRPIASERDFTDFINGLNTEWVAASQRLSPRVLTDHFARASEDIADWFESVPFEAPALFGVSWAGEQTSAGWFDIGREFTELWHHQRQIRIAVDEVEDEHPKFLNAVLDVAMRGLPHALRDVPASAEDAIAIDVDGLAGGAWALRHDGTRWTLWRGTPGTPTARLRMDADVAWQLLFNALARTGDVRARLTAEGRTELIDGFLRARSVIV